MDTTTFPTESTATQSVVEGHDTPVSGWASIAIGAEKSSRPAARAGAVASAPTAIITATTATQPEPERARDGWRTANANVTYSLTCACFDEPEDPQLPDPGFHHEHTPVSATPLTAADAVRNCRRHHPKPDETHHHFGQRRPEPRGR